MNDLLHTCIVCTPCCVVCRILHGNKDESGFSENLRFAYERFAHCRGIYIMSGTLVLEECPMLSITNLWSRKLILTVS